MSITKMDNGTYKINVYMGAGFSRFIDYADTKNEALIIEQEAKLRKLKGEIKKKKNDNAFSEVYEMWWNKKYMITKHQKKSHLSEHKIFFAYIFFHTLEIEKSKK